MISSELAYANCRIHYTGPTGDLSPVLVCFVDTISVGGYRGGITFETPITEADFSGLLSSGVVANQPFDPQELNEDLKETGKELCNILVNGADERCRNNVYDNARQGVMDEAVTLCDQVQHYAQAFSFNFGTAGAQLGISASDFASLFTNCPETIRQAETIERNYCINKKTSGLVQCVQEFG